ncbi:hypothetical protein Q8F55_008009 [Vanrija albida]|uniref:Uncharacterized protein n=1 Tax=Vanrija albida TaxID=181172 RepID=A0ABR3PV39_9TREE
MSPELISIICEHLSESGDLATLATVARCSEAAYAIAVSKLYSRLVITRDNADLLFVGVPRSEYGFNPASKEVYDAALAAFDAKYHDAIDPVHPKDRPEQLAPQPVDDDGAEDELRPRSEWDELVFDDDAYDEEAAVAESNAASWDRRLELLEACESLTIESVPRLGLVRDLLAAAGIHMNYSNATEWSENEDAVPIFPNLRRIAFSAAAVDYIADYEHAHMNNFEPEMYDSCDGSHDESEESYFPFGHLVRFAFGAPEDVCITAPTSVVSRSTFIFNMLTLSKPVSKITHEAVWSASRDHRDEGEHTIASQLSALAFYSLPREVKTVTYHRMRGPVQSGTKAERYRLFYDAADPPVASADQRAKDILAGLAFRPDYSGDGNAGQEPGADLELIDVERGTDATEGAIRLAVDQAMAADPKKYTVTDVAFAPEDSDAQLEQELANTKTNLDELGPLRPTMGAYRVMVGLDKAEAALEAALGTPDEDEKRKTVAEWEAAKANADKATEHRRARERLEADIKRLTEEIEDARKDAREKRVLASNNPRVVYTAGADAAPCIVCGASDASA